MTDIHTYQVALELYHQNGTALAREAVTVDWEPACAAPCCRSLARLRPP